MRSCRQMSQVPWLLFCLSSFQKSLFTLPHIPWPEFHEYRSLSIFPNAVYMGRGDLSAELWRRVAWGAAHSITSEKLHNSQKIGLFSVFIKKSPTETTYKHVFCFFTECHAKNSPHSQRNSCFLFSQQRHFSTCFLSIALVSSKILLKSLLWVQLSPVCSVTLFYNLFRGQHYLQLLLLASYSQDMLRPQVF